MNRAVGWSVSILMMLCRVMQAQQIVIDGRTHTTQQTNGSVTNVNTYSVSGNNAFNSFSHFDVKAGTTANLHLPSGTSNLINVVTSSRTDINGVLNSVKDGQIGGNVYFVNPHGFVVSYTGVVNVGSLSVTTPMQHFADGFFNNPLTREASTAQVITGTARIDERGFVRNEGTINARDEISLYVGDVDNSATMQTGASYSGSVPHFTNVVNTNGFANGSRIVVSNGEIEIEATDTITNTGVIANVNGNDVSLTAEEVDLTGRGTISSRAGTTAQAGDITIEATRQGRLEHTRFDVADGRFDYRAPLVDAGPNVLGIAGTQLKIDLLRIAGTYATAGESNEWRIDGAIDIAANAILTTDNPTVRAPAGSLTLRATRAISIDDHVRVSTVDSNGDHAGELVLAAGEDLTFSPFGVQLLTESSSVKDDGGRLLLESGATLTLPAQTVFRAGALTIASAESWSVPFDLVTPDGDIRLSSGKTLDIAGKNLSTKDSATTPPGMASGDVSLTGIGGIIDADAIFARTISMTSGTTLSLQSRLTARGGNINLVAADAISLRQPLRARDGHVLVDAGAEIAGAAVETSVDDSSDTLTLGRGATIRARAITLTADDDITIDRHLSTFGGDLSLLAGHNLTVNGNKTVQGEKVYVKAGGDVVINSGANVTSTRYNVDIEAGGTVELAGNITADDGTFGAVDILEPSGSIDIDAQGGVTFKGGQLTASARDVRWSTYVTLGGNPDIADLIEDAVGPLTIDLTLVEELLNETLQSAPVFGEFALDDIDLPDAISLAEILRSRYRLADFAPGDSEKGATINDVRTALRDTTLIEELRKQSDSIETDLLKEVIEQQGGSFVKVDQNAILILDPLDSSVIAQIPFKPALETFMTHLHFRELLPSDGNIEITAKGDITFQSTGGQLSAHDIDHAGNIELRAGTAILDSTNEVYDGSVVIDSGGPAVLIDANGTISANDGGLITISGPSGITLRSNTSIDGGSVDLLSTGRSAGTITVPMSIAVPDGDLTIDSDGNVTLLSGITLSTINSDSHGKAGNLSVRAHGNLTIVSGSPVHLLADDTTIADDGGTITLHAGGTLSIPAATEIRGGAVDIGERNSWTVPFDLFAPDGGIGLVSGGP